MTNVPLSYLPGVTKSVSPYAASKQQGSIDQAPAYGRFVDMDGVRFAGGYPEKIGGSELLYSSALTGVPRGLRDWRDFSQVIYLGIGTNAKLYYYSDSILHDITPLRGVVTGTLTNAITTISGSDIVTINDVAHGQQQGDYVILTAASAVGGVLVAGVYFIEQVVDVDNYKVTLIDTATSSATGGGSLAYTYFRITLSNPFDTVSGSSTVTVNQPNHGASTGDYVTISGASAIAGLTLSGEYAITSSDSDSYTVTASGNANATVSGGGGTPNFQYDISVGLVDTALAYGFGTDGYSSNGYGTAGTIGFQLNARTWCLAKYGQQLLANPVGGGIYVWDPTVGGRAYPLYNAPTECNFMFVTPERFVVALGINGNPMEMGWCDQEDYTVWTSLPTNTANSGRTLQEGSRLVGGISTRNGVSMVFSDTAAYNMNYTGDNNVYETLVAGKKCGLIGPLALTDYGDVIAWMSDNDFWMWNGAVQKLPTDDIRVYVYDDINRDQSAKFVASTINERNEVIFQYCTENSDENDRWLKYHTDQDCFSIGTVMPRTSWLDQELFNRPIATTSDGYLFYQEIGNDDNGAAIDSYIEFGAFDISNGDVQMDVFGFIPDVVRQTGDIDLTVTMRDYPQSTPTTDGPYTIPDDGSIPIIDLRSNGRLIGYRLESNEIGGDWRLGLPRAAAQPAGSRR